MPLTTDDKLEIMELVSRYNFAIDRREPEGWANVFTEDGALWSDGNLRAAGRKDLEEYMRLSARNGHPIRHFTSNTLIEGDGDHATLRMYVMAWNIANGGMVPYVMGEYDDILARVDGRWKFQLRRVTPHAGKVLPQPVKSPPQAGRAAPASLKMRAAPNSDQRL